MECSSVGYGPWTLGFRGYEEWVVGFGVDHRLDFWLEL